jgi:hypothetical protein
MFYYLIKISLCINISRHKIQLTTTDEKDRKYGTDEIRRQTDKRTINLSQIKMNKKRKRHNKKKKNNKKKEKSKKKVRKK